MAIVPAVTKNVKSDNIENMYYISPDEIDWRKKQLEKQFSEYIKKLKIKPKKQPICYTKEEYLNQNKLLTKIEKDFAIVVSSVRYKNDKSEDK